MPTFFRGGWSKVEYDDNPAFTSPTEIPNLLKEGTGIEFETPTEELADGTEAAAGKKARITIRSKDLTAAVYTELVTAETNVTKLHFRFTGLNTAQKVVVKNVIPVVEYDMKQAGAFNARKVTGVGFAIDEATLLTVTV
jgi:hypothetical protein